MAKRADEKASQLESAAQVYRVALSDLTKAMPGEDFHDALVRLIDSRAWYRRLWRFITRRSA